LKSVMSDKYRHLRSVVMETENSVAKSLSSVSKHAIEAVAHAKDVSTEKVVEIAKDVNKNVHRNPWPYIAGTAVAGVLAGYLLGRNRK